MVTWPAEVSSKEAGSLGSSDRVFSDVDAGSSDFSRSSDLSKETRNLGLYVVSPNLKNNSISNSNTYHTEKISKRIRN